VRGRGEQAYAWAKASGIVGSSFLSRRLPSLLALNRPSDLDRLLFPVSPLQLPERELSVALQRRIAERSAARTLAIVDCFSAPAPPLVLLLRAYEYVDLKSALAASVSGEREAPSHVDLGRYGQLRWDAYPDFSRMAAGTEFSWIDPPASDAELVDVESELDKRYYAALWDQVRRLPRRDRFGLEALIAEEISLKNVVWSLRLRAYYGLSGVDLDGRLLDLRRGAVSLAADARACADFALDRRADWQKWRRRSLLNLDSGGASWRVDPRAVQNAAARRLYAASRRVFRSCPFSVASIAAFIRLMQFEEDILTSVAEGLALGLSAKEVIAVLEVSA
jgi:hypothetical protein